MKTIQILGTGCAKCIALTANAEKAAQALGIEFRIEKITSIDAITRMGVMLTPALAVDGKVVSQGRVLLPDQIRALLG